MKDKLYFMSHNLRNVLDLGCGFNKKKKEP